MQTKPIELQSVCCFLFYYGFGVAVGLAPLRGLLASPRPTACREHKAEGMVDLANPKCRALGCQVRPTFNLPGGRPRICALHRTAKMVDVGNRRCRARKDGLLLAPHLRLPTSTILAVRCRAQNLGRPPGRLNVGRTWQPGARHSGLARSTMPLALCSLHAVCLGLQGVPACRSPVWC